MRSCFITTCSSQKIGGGSPYSDFKAASSELSPKLLKTRQKVYQSIKNGQIPGDLRGATEGPDFAGSQSGAYLSAFDRYNAGSFTSALSREIGIATETWLNENSLFYISGLYGLLESHEPIQNYNVRLEHTCEFWTRDVVTNAFIAELGPPEGDNLLVNCCADPLYSKQIDWERLTSLGYLVRHVVGRGFEGRQIRSAAASVAARVDSKYQRDLILRGSIVRCVDADIRFIGTDDYRSFRDECSSEADKKCIGIIVMKPGDREEFLKRFGAGFSRHVGFEFVERSQGKEGLKKLQAAGCKQCLYRILKESHADVRDGFGHDLNIEIGMHSMDPLGFENFSQLRLDVRFFRE